MIDIQLIRDNPDLIIKKSQEKNVEVDIDKIVKLDVEHRDLLQQVEAMRAKRNEISEKMKSAISGDKPDQSLIDEGRQLKVELSERQGLLNETSDELQSELKKVPNPALEHVPVGKTEDDNVIAKVYGKKPEFDFKPRPHWEIAEQRDLFDKERASKVSGSRFVYIKGGLVNLQFAITQFVMDTLGDEKIIEKLVQENQLNISSKPFTPILPPALVRTEPYEASSRLNAKETTYKLEGDDLWLNASAEHVLCNMYWNEIIPQEKLPVRYIGYLTSFRREAGTYGKDTEGIIRLHQFDKLEMEVFSTADTGLDEHKLTIAIQEYLVQQLGLHYNFVQKSTADIGAPNASGIDIDCWFPGQEKYIETHTSDYMTDYQARDLKTRTKKDGEVQLVHTNDATAFALSRILAAILEHYQNEDGTVRVPEVLQKYMGGRKTI